MIKNFPKSRVCVIDVYPALVQGIKKAREFANKHNFSLSSADGKRILFGFCIKNIQEIFSKAESPYTKVLCLSKKQAPRKLTPFIENHFSKIIERCPFPYCGIHELTSPDLEMAAQNSLEKTTSKKRSFEKLITSLKLRNVQ